MGRKKIQTEKKKAKLSVTISSENVQRLNDLETTNKSKLINWLLLEHFDLTKKGGKDE